MNLLNWLYKERNKDELQYMLKLDFFLMSSAMLGYLIKNLNQKNMSTLFMNGMSEYYGMDKNEFNIMQTSFFLGYLLGGFPSKILMARFKIRHYLGFLELTWAFLTLSMCLCQTIQQVYVVRFLIGFLELGFFPSIVFIIGSFYNEDEINKRQLLFNVSGTLGTMITGPLQQLILSYDLNLNFEKFQILFLLDALISVPIAIYTMSVNPGGLKELDIWYLNDKDREILLQRLNPEPEIVHRESFKTYLRSWHMFLFPLLFALIRNSSFAAEQIVATSWIKYDLELPSFYYNYFPALVNALAIVFTISVSVINDTVHGLFTAKLIYLFFILYFVFCSLLAYWHIPVWLHWICYIVIGSITWPLPQLFSWLNRSVADDSAKRHFVVVLTNSFDYAIYAFYPLLVWDTRDKPEFHKGFISTMILCCVGILITKITDRLDKRDKKIKGIDEFTPLL